MTASVVAESNNRAAYIVVIVLCQTILVYFLVSHVSHLYNLFKTKLSHDGHASRQHQSSMSCVIIAVIMLNIAYLSVALASHSGAPQSVDCNGFVKAKLLIITFSSYLVEIFFNSRALQVIQDSVHLFGTHDRGIKWSIATCKTGLVLSVVCMVVQLFMVGFFVNFTADTSDNEFVRCVDDSGSALVANVGASMVVLYAALSIAALFVFVYPLVRYKSVLAQHQLQMSEAHEKNEPNTANLLTALGEILKRVSSSSLVTHCFVIAAAVFCIAISRSQSSDAYSTRIILWLSIYAVTNVTMVIMMDLTFSDWKERLLICLNCINK